MAKRNKKISVKLLPKQALNYRFKQKSIIKRIALVNDLDNNAIEVLSAIEVGGDVIVPVHKADIINNIKSASYFPYELSVVVNKNETITGIFNKSVTVVINIQELDNE